MSKQTRSGADSLLRQPRRHAVRPLCAFRFRTNPDEFTRRVRACVNASKLDATVTPGINLAPINSNQQRDALEAIYGNAVRRAGRDRGRPRAPRATCGVCSQQAPQGDVWVVRRDGPVPAPGTA